jgi:hypothetical protein
MPLRVQSSAGMYIIFGGVFHARKSLHLGPKRRNLLCSLPVSGSNTLFKNSTFLDALLARKHVDFGIENRPKKVSFLGYVGTTKQEDMLGCHVLVPKIFRPPQ